mgnify:FL=1|jgi:membrane-bound lytic murein transglycosylase D
MAALLGVMPAMAQKNRNVNSLRTEITDSHIVYPKSYEADTQRMLEGWYMQNYTATDDSYRRKGDVEVSDAVLRDRLSKLPTVIDMPYNSIVRNYIERYTRRGRDQVAALLGLSLYYMPIFEQALEAEGLPLELKYLPVIESALDPNATSKHGAAGLWQFMVGTGKGLGLEVNSMVDERRDPYKSSEKAAKYLKDLYNSYGDWSLAIAAYNCGPGAVNKALRRAGGTPDTQDYWSIYYYLSPETRGYVPMFIAANYVMNYYDKHNIGPVLPTKPLVMDTVHVSERIHFNQISNVLDIPVEELRVLNPQFRADIIPGNNERSYTLILPSRQVQAYLMSEEEIRDYNADKYARRVVAEPGSEPDAQLAAVIAQEDAEELANEEHDQAKDLPAPRNTEEVAVTRDRRGSQQQHLDTGNTNAQADAASDYRAARQSARRQSGSTYDASSAQRRQTATKSSKTTARKKKAQPAAPKSHIVKSGDNLSNIAKKYGTTVAALKKANGITGSGDALQPGDKLKLPGKSRVSSSKSKSKSKSKGTSSKSKKKKRRR